MVDYKIIDKLCDTLSEVLGSQFEFYKQDTQCTARYPDIWSLANEPGEPTRSFIFQQVSTHERCQTSLYIPLIERYADRGRVSVCDVAVSAQMFVQYLQRTRVNKHRYNIFYWTMLWSACWHTFRDYRL